MKKIFTLCFLLAFVCLKSSGQIFTENFESYASTSILSTSASSTGWQTTDNAQGLSSHWCFARNSSYNIAGNTSLAVGLTNLFATTIDPGNYSPIERNVIAYKQFSSSGYSSLKLNFKWKCEGESFFGAVDYGTVCYSTDGTNWTDLSAKYLNQSTTQTVTNLSLPASLNNLGVVYLGFRWRNNTDFFLTDVYPPGFIVDDISLTGAISCTTAPTAGTTIASPATICSGSSSTLSLTNASTTNVSYQWQSSASLNGNYSNINGATNATYTASPTTSTYYRCNVICATNSSLFNSSVPALVNVTSAPPPVGTITSSAAACAGASITYSVAAVANASYTWTVPTGWKITNGGTTNSITVTAGAAGQNGNITVVASNACGSSADISNTIDIAPVNAANGTGYVTKSNNNYSKNSGIIQVSNGLYTGYLKFDLSGLSGVTSITGATLTLTNNGSETGSKATNYTVPLGNNDPLTASASTLYNTTNSHSTYYSAEPWSPTATSITLDLNTGNQSASTDILSRIASPGYLAIGLYRGGYAVYNFYGYNGATPPKLSITYTAPRSLAVTVNALPTVAAIGGGASSVCAGSSTVAFTDATTGGSWSVTNGTGSATITTGGVLTGVTAGTVTVVYTYNNGTCSNSVTKQVSVIALPTSTISAPATACFGETPLVLISGTSGDKVTFTDGTTSRTITINSNGNYPYNATNLPVGTTTFAITQIQHGSTCPNNSPNVSASVTVFANPDAAITANNYVQIGGPVLTLSATTPNGTWSVDNTNLSLGTASNNTIPATALQLGTATVSYSVSQVHGAATCSSTGSKLVNITAQFVTRANGNFSQFNTWDIYSQNGPQASMSSIPATGNSVDVQHNLALDADYTSGSYFTITGSGSMEILSNKVFSSTGGVVDFGGKPVIVRSTYQGTGAIGKIEGTTIANPNLVTVEQYTHSRRAWRFITAPLTGVSLNDGWQNGVVTKDLINFTKPDGTPATAPAAGVGTAITASGLTATSSPTASSLGFDYIPGTTSSTSAKYYNANGAGSWIPLAGTASENTTNTLISDQHAWMLFVRGDHYRGFNGSSATTLRPQGILKQGLQQIPIPGIAASNFVAVSNPYASPIDFGALSLANNSVIEDKFYVWDTHLGTYGGWAFLAGTDYQAVPSPITTPGLTTVNRYIQSSEGFLIVPKGGGGTLSFTEGVKDAVGHTEATASPFKVVPAPTNVRQLIVNLNQKNSDGSSVLADGFRAKFSPDYEDNEEDNSAAKPSNFNENLSLIRNGITHIVEAHDEVKKTDTLQLKLWNVSYRNYELQMQASNFSSAPGTKAWLEDSYLQTKQPVDLTSGVTTIEFTINKDSGSWKSTRFRIVFENNAVVLPVAITKVSASQKDGGAEVSWTVANEVNVKGYTVEKSADGRTFTTVGTQQAAKNNGQAALTNYSGYDAQPKNGDNYYRIKIEGTDGKISYSEVVKVTIGNAGTGIQIALYPNPVREGKASLQLTNLEEGTYLVGVYSGSGQTIYQKKITITTGGTTQTEPLLLGKGLAQGSYQMRVADHKGTVLFTDKLIVGR